MKKNLQTLVAFGALVAAGTYFSIGWVRTSNTALRRAELERASQVDSSLSNHVRSSRGDIDVLHASRDPVVLYIHRESCNACASLKPWWHEISDSLENHGQQALMIALDSMSQVKPLGERKGVDYAQTAFPLALARTLGIRRIPTTLMVDSGKVIVRVDGAMRSSDVPRFSAAWRKRSENSL
jgi:thiol-disulfide isomerase/thioredoxin